jgi:hypothetical protein
MHRLKTLSVILLLLFATLACATLTSEEDFSSVTEEPFSTEEPINEEQTVAEGAICTDVTNQIMEIATSGSESSSEGESEAVPEEATLVTYEVNGDEISNPLFEDVSSDLQEQQADETTQQQVWDYYAALIPVENRNTIIEYSIFTDGVDNTLASVTQAQTDPEAWALQVDIADTSDYYNLTYTLVHEYGHLLTLGPDQVPPSLAVFNNPEDNDIYLQELSACPDYFPGEGCANPDSYINAFYNQFWADIHAEWQEINLEEDPDLLQQGLDDFYAKYQDQFVTDYAATNPEEDMAESWAFFVLSEEPAGDTLAEQKTLFFYNYPELVELRSAILNNLCTSFPQQ